MHSCILNEKNGWVWTNNKTRRSIVIHDKHSNFGPGPLSISIFRMFSTDFEILQNMTWYPLQRRIMAEQRDTLII